MALTLTSALLLAAFGRIWGEFINLGDSFKFATNKTCGGGGGEMKLMRGLETDGTFLPVARLDGGVWTPEEGYRERIDHHSASSFSLTDVKFNDGGLYEFTCRGERIAGIQLQVLIITDRSGTEGQKVKVPCFYFTAGSNREIKGVRWTLNGETVLEQDVSGSSSGSGRASVAPDWHLTGDLSLTLDPVRAEDQGDLICYIKEGEEEKRGSPGPVRLTVLKNNPPPDFSSPPSDPCPTPRTPEVGVPGWAVFCIVLNVLLFIVAAIFLALWLRSRRPAAAAARQRGGDKERTPGNQVQGNGSLHVAIQGAEDDGLIGTTL